VAVYIANIRQYQLAVRTRTAFYQSNVGADDGRLGIAVTSSIVIAVGHKTTVDANAALDKRTALGTGAALDIGAAVDKRITVCSVPDDDVLRPIAQQPLCSMVTPDQHLAIACRQSKRRRNRHNRIGDALCADFSHTRFSYAVLCLPVIERPRDGANHYAYRGYTHGDRANKSGGRGYITCAVNRPANFNSMACNPAAMAFLPRMIAQQATRRPPQ
jgi:hypothetical protein